MRHYTSDQVAEILEVRTVLSSVSITVAGGIVKVQGTHLDDDVRLSLTDGVLRVHYRTRDTNGIWSEYAEKSIGAPDRLKSIQFDGGGGNDRFQGNNEGFFWEFRGYRI